MKFNQLVALLILPAWSWRSAAAPVPGLPYRTDPHTLGAALLSIPRVRSGALVATLKAPGAPALLDRAPAATRS